MTFLDAEYSEVTSGRKKEHNKKNCFFKGKKTVCYDYGFAPWIKVLRDFLS